MADEIDEGHIELARERWQHHRERHEAEDELSAERWAGHKDQHDSIARSLVEYKAQSNEWRGSLSDLRSTFAARVEVEALEQAIRNEREERLNQQNLRVGQQKGVSQTTAILLTILSVAGTIIGIIGGIAFLVSAVSG